MNVQEIINTMAREYTGHTLCDSGVVYGYIYNTPLPKKPLYFRVDRWTDEDGEEQVELLGWISTPHLLAQTLDMDDEAEALEAAFQAFLDRPEHEAVPWIDLMEMFAEQMGAIVEVTNSYNCDNDLDQVIQFVHFEKDGGEYVLLHTHNGCDVRAGYARPHCFHIRDESSFCDWRIHFYCDTCDEDVEQCDAMIIAGHDETDLTITHRDCGGRISWYSPAEGF